ncbi:amino acid adenylation domain-containing protein [Streptomyces sp. NPDC087917]|uniref:amino acid adenylation domain-containing protein n=1 Tax=Streptomyces sp. NPDC087917 TaxID=3155060 RepID=UPI003441168C
MSAPMSAPAYARHDVTVHHLVAVQAAARPDAVAVLARDAPPLTYRALDERSTALARRLAAQGLRPGRYVAVRMRRTPAFVVALLAVLKAGGIYAAMDPNWPEARVRQLIGKADAHVLTDDGPDDGFALEPAPGRHRLRLQGPPGSGPLPTAAPGDGCALMFTSGTSGEPKGSLSPHRAVASRFVGVDYADFGPGRTVLQAAPVCWDAMMIELWSVLMNGGTSLLLGEGKHLSPALVREYAAGAGLDTLWLTAALFNTFVDDDPGCFTGLRQVLTGGERLSPGHVAGFRAAHPGIRLVNGYGPVETTVFATTRVIEDGDAARYGQIPLGTALPGTSVHVLDAQDRPCPPGTTGEICIGGSGLALGYLGEEELTARKFVTLPGGERVYRSGDLGSLHPDGLLLYAGRQDRQVKIRGQRVEPAELERFLEHAGVPRAVVTVLRDPGGAAGGLAAHCLAPADGRTADDLRASCHAGLPPYLRPRQLTLLDAFPLTASGKVDLRALAERPAPDPAGPRSGEPDQDGAAHTPVLEAVLTSAGALAGRSVGPDEDLFQTGVGDSLFAMQLTHRLELHHGVRVTLDTVHEGRTPRAIAAGAEPLDEAAGGQPGDGEGADDRTAPGQQEVVDSRQDLWLQEQLAPGDPAHLLVLSFAVAPALDTARLRTALAAVADRHPALRTVFRLDGPSVVAHELPGAVIPVEETARDAGLAGALPDAWLKPFDLAADPPLRCFVTPCDTGSVLTLVLHHIAYDGWSERVFLTDLAAAYGRADEAAGPAEPGAVDPVRAPRSAPRDEAAVARARGHWQHALAPARPLALPAGTPGGARFAQRRLALDAAEVGALCARTHRSAHFSALAWYGTALHRATGTDRFALATYHAGRERVGGDVVGYFVRPIPLVLDFGSCDGPAELAAAARRDWLAGVGLAPLPLSDLAAVAPRPDDPRLPPVFQAAVIYQNAPAADLRLPGHEVVRRDVPPPAASLPLLVQIWPAADGSWSVWLECDPARVREAFLDELASSLTDLLHPAGAASRGPVPSGPVSRGPG